MGANQHPTVEPEQSKTDEFAVFASIPREPNLQLIDRVEVPRYSQPNADGVELSRVKRLSLAVARAIESGEWCVLSSHSVDQCVTPEHPDYEFHVEEMDGAGTVMEIEGMEFMVMTDIAEPMAFVQYEQNPAFDGVWNPEEA